MTEKEFKDKIIDIIKDIMYDINPDCELERKYIEKINLKNDAICIKMPDKPIVPSLNLNEIMKTYIEHENAKNIDDIENISLEFRDYLQEYLKNVIKDIPKINKDLISMEFDSIKDSIYPVLINTNNNQNLLNELPYMPMAENLASIFKAIKFEPNGNFAINISHEILKLWDKTFDEIVDIAMHNIKKPGFAQAFPLACYFIDKSVAISDDTLNETYPSYITAGSNYMYCVSNRYTSYGASMILYQDLMKKICNDLQAKELYVLPSSLHETIVMPVDPNMSNEDIKDIEKYLKEMVTEINKNNIDEADKLSDSVYIYDGNSLQAI